MTRAITCILVKIIAYTMFIVWYVKKKYRYVSKGYWAYDRKVRRSKRKALKEIRENKRLLPPGVKPPPPPMPPKLSLALPMEVGAISIDYANKVVFARELEWLDTCDIWLVSTMDSDHTLSGRISGETDGFSVTFEPGKNTKIDGDKYESLIREPGSVLDLLIRERKLMMVREPWENQKTTRLKHKINAP